MSAKRTFASAMLSALIWQLPLSGQLVAKSHAGEDIPFTGSWVANGSKEVLALGSGRETALFRLAGHVSLKADAISKEKDFWGHCIGLADSSTGSDIRCVWRSLDGNEIYLTLQGTRMEKGSRITGNIVGGNGPFNGITGQLHFTWNSMSFEQVNDESGIAGFAKDITGSYQLP